MELHRPVVSVYTVPTGRSRGGRHAGLGLHDRGICEVSAGDATGTGWTYGPAAVGDFLTAELAMGVRHEQVPVYDSGGFTTYHDTLPHCLEGVGGAPTAAQLNGWVHGQHIPHVKIKIGEGWGREVTRDLHRVRSARHVVGPDAELYVDAASTCPASPG
jgi:hypothetical protein